MYKVQCRFQQHMCEQYMYLRNNNPNYVNASVASTHTGKKLNGSVFEN